MKTSLEDLLDQLRTKENVVTRSVIKDIIVDRLKNNDYEPTPIKKEIKNV